MHAAADSWHMILVCMQQQVNYPVPTCVCVCVYCPASNCSTFCCPDSIPESQLPCSKSMICLRPVLLTVVLVRLQEDRVSLCSWSQHPEHHSQQHLRLQEWNLNGYTAHSRYAFCQAYIVCHLIMSDWCRMLLTCSYDDT